MNRYLERLKKALDCVEIRGFSGETLEYTEGISALVDLFLSCKRSRKTIYICGNGGSAGIAQHMTGDFLKNGGLHTYSLYEQTVLTCISNDLSYEYVFSKQLELAAGAGEVLIAISSSGESENIVKAIRTIRDFGGRVITLTGFRPDNRIREMGDINIYVPEEHYGIVESVHNIILQQIVDEIVQAEGVALKMDEE
ncbi:SIS domain-containing protein [Lachnospiraceae bacterium 38-10]